MLHFKFENGKYLKCVIQSFSELPNSIVDICGTSLVRCCSYSKKINNNLSFCIINRNSFFFIVSRGLIKYRVTLSKPSNVLKIEINTVYQNIYPIYKLISLCYAGNQMFAVKTNCKKMLKLIQANQAEGISVYHPIIQSTDSFAS